MMFPYPVIGAFGTPLATFAIPAVSLLGVWTLIAALLVSTLAILASNKVVRPPLRHAGGIDTHSEADADHRDAA
jgi:hypothetical protein